jgi:hypothetical protein
MARARSYSRPFSTAGPAQSETNEKDKDKLYVDSQEYSKSGYDGQAAQTEETAFAKKRTDPEEQRVHAEHESKKVWEE